MSDLSTLGVTIHYGVETKAGSKPTSFIWLKRCNAIDGISLDTDQIDVSALEDYIAQYTAGRQDTGGSWTVTFNMNPDVITAIKKLFSDAKTAKSSGLNVWFEIVFQVLQMHFCYCRPWNKHSTSGYFSGFSGNIANFYGCKRI